MTTQEKSKFQDLATAYTVGVCTITADMKLVTGLHIGGGNEAYSIGGSDNPIVRDLVTGLPYVPGSSLKGKMRHLLARLQERKDGGLLHGVEADAPEIKLVFGSHEGKPDFDGKIVPAMLSVRDAFVDEDFAESQKSKNPLLTETKFENTIDRATAVANPRNLERVPAGTTFKVELQLRLPNLQTEGIDSDKASDYLEYLVLLPLLGLALLEQDALGGGGSRGSGQVEFTITKVDAREYPPLGNGVGQEQVFSSIKTAVDNVLKEKGRVDYSALIEQLQALGK
jgi:CRISPR-associated protein Csm3